MHRHPPSRLQRARDMRHEPTDAEHCLWQHLRGRRLLGWKFRRQVPLGNYIVDFVCHEKWLVIELDGSQHQQQSEYDAARSRFLETQGYRVLRYWNHDVLLRGESVLEAIVQALGQDAKGGA